MASGSGKGGRGRRGGAKRKSNRGGRRNVMLSNALQRREAYTAPNRRLRRQGQTVAIPSRWMV